MGKDLAQHRSGFSFEVRLVGSTRTDRLRKEVATHVKDAQDGLRLSRRSVTGPSLTSSTFIIARKTPMATSRPECAMRSAQRRYSRSASPGSAAAVKLGRRPLRQ